MLGDAAQVGRRRVPQALEAGVGERRPLPAPVVVAGVPLDKARGVTPERDRSSRSASSLIRSRRSPVVASWTSTS